MDDTASRLPGLLWNLVFRDGAAAGASVAEDEADWTWAHYPLGDVRAKAALRKVADLPEQAQELFAAHESRVHIDQEKGWTFGVLPDLERDLQGQAGEAARVVFALNGERLITARHHPLLSIDDLRRRAESGERMKSPAMALGLAVEIYVEHVEDMVEALGERLGGVEDYVLTEPQDLTDIGLSPLRRTLARHRRELQALRGALSRAGGRRTGGKAEHLADWLPDIVAWIEDVDREAAALQDRARLLHEEIDTLINNATSRSSRALAIMSTLLVPPTLITGAFGMNLSGLPFGKSHIGFMWALVLCIAVVGGAWWFLCRLELV
jgi:zinc transporter